MYKFKLVRISPMDAAKIAAVLYGAIGIIAVPFFLLGAVLSEEGALIGVTTALFMPVLYILIGFLGALISAAIFNLVAGWLGGVGVNLESENVATDPPSAA